MNKILLCLAILLCLNSYSQIQIDKSDMPKADTQFYLSTNITAGTTDYTKTGENYNWDFSSLTPLSSTADTFIKVSETPLVYRLIFYNASVAQPQGSMNFIPGFNLSNIYAYFLESSTSYTQLGFGASLNGLTIPFKFDNPDVIYKLPLEYGNIDSNISVFKVSMPNLGYLSQVKNRRNYVDGWGTVTTPLSTFQALRVRSEVTENDSIFIDTLGIHLPAITRNYTEYKWLAKGYTVPVLQITKELLLVNVAYLDTVRASVNNKLSGNLNINIFPNPASDKLFINLSLNLYSPLLIELYDLIGNKIFKINGDSSPKGEYNNYIDLKKYNLENGIYLLKITTDNDLITKKIIIN